MYTAYDTDKKSELLQKENKWSAPRTMENK